MLKTFSILFFLLSLFGCNLTAPPTPQPTLTPTPTEASLEISVWENIAPGLDRRVDVPEGNGLGQIVALRIDPAQYRFRAHYRPGEPLNLLEWREELPEAVALINANFFTPENTVLGLLVADGQMYGASYTNQGGMFAIENGVPRIRSNVTEPYMGETFEQAIQAFPMLIEDGTVVYTDTSRDRQTRRTVIAMDGAGRVLLIVTPLLGLRLADLAAFLAQTDYGIVDALNLDGGGSTMMLIRPLNFTLVSLDSVPAVLGDISEVEFIMGNKTKQRKRMFDKHALNWSAVKREAGLSFESELPDDIFICPLCLREFPRQVISNPNILSLEHVPPEAVGGKARTLTCKECNNWAGKSLDSQLKI